MYCGAFSTWGGRRNGLAHSTRWSTTATAGRHQSRSESARSTSGLPTTRFSPVLPDRFQYRDRYDEDVEQRYDGPWQEMLRDIDPSCTLGSTPGGTHSGGHSSSWWAETQISDWEESVSHRNWITKQDGLPPFEGLLIVDDPDDNIRWVNLGAFFLWQQPLSADVDLGERDRREINAFCTGYLIRSNDTEAFVKWAAGVNFWGKWMPEAPEMRRVFVGEYEWSRAFQHVYQEWY